MPARVRLGGKSNLPRKKLARRKALVLRYSPGNLLRKFLFLTISLLVLGLSVKTYFSWHNRVWSEGVRFSVVVATEDPTVYSLNSQNKTLTVIKFPAETQVVSSHGYGTWFLGSLWELGQQEGLDGELLANSVKKSFGIPIDAWVDGRGENFFKPKPLGILVTLKEALISTGTKTNLTFFDRLNVLVAAASIGAADRREILPEARGVISKEKLPDNIEGYKVIPEKAKVVFEKTFRDDGVFQEGKTVKIINATEKPGLAGEAATVSELLGVRVIGVSSKEFPVEGCILIGEKDNLASLTAKRLSKIFSCPVQERKPDIAHLELILGSGFARRF